jgi:hypothetical protein
MELEIKGFIEFCRAISSNPTEVAKSKQLVDALSFCLNSVSNCNCSNKPSAENFEKKYLEMANEFSNDSLNVLSVILDPNSTYSNIYISFPYSENKIKIK